MSDFKPGDLLQFAYMNDTRIVDKDERIVSNVTGKYDLVGGISLLVSVYGTELTWLTNEGSLCRNNFCRSLHSDTLYDSYKILPKNVNEC
jgi:hypothetical protein